MARVGIGVVLLLAVVVGAQARTLRGVEVPETFSLEDRTLTLNGAGYQREFLFTVYVAALYLESPTGDAVAAVGEERAKVLTVHFPRGRDRDDLVALFHEGFFNNVQEQLPRLQGRLDRMTALFPDGVGAGQTLVLAYRPAHGTRVTVGERNEVLEGADFMAALWAVWLGDVPADHDLKRALLGRE